MGKYVAFRVVLSLGLAASLVCLAGCSSRKPARAEAVPAGEEAAEPPDDKAAEKRAERGGKPRGDEPRSATTGTGKGRERPRESPMELFELGPFIALVGEQPRVTATWAAIFTLRPWRKMIGKERRYSLELVVRMGGNSRTIQLSAAQAQELIDLVDKLQAIKFRANDKGVESSRIEVEWGDLLFIRHNSGPAPSFELQHLDIGGGAVAPDLLKERIRLALKALDALKAAEPAATLP